VTTRNIICLVIDRLHAGMLGAYGNTWIRTPELDQFAAESFIFDQAFTPCPRLEAFYDAVWQSMPFDERNLQSTAPGDMPHAMAARGMHTALITDDPALAKHPAAEHFAERITIDSAECDASASDPAETAFARLCSAVGEWLPTAREPFCLWIHASGMAGPWDAPLEYRNEYAEEDDPEPPSLVQPPSLLLAEKHDPDEPLGYAHAYAGQIALIDLCWGALWEEIRQQPWYDRAVITLLGARGFALGEHRRVGACEEALFSESVQIPWLMRFPDRTGALARTQALVVPADLPGTLIDWVDEESNPTAAARASSLLEIIRDQRVALRDRIVLALDGERALRTPAWYLRRPVEGPVELYAKPGDRWEFSEIARLLPEVVAGLEQALAETSRAGNQAKLPELPELLRTEVD